MELIRCGGECRYNYHRKIPGVNAEVASDDSDGTDLSDFIAEESGDDEEQQVMSRRKGETNQPGIEKRRALNVPHGLLAQLGDLGDFVAESDAEEETRGQQADKEAVVDSDSEVELVATPAGNA